MVTAVHVWINHGRQITRCYCGALIEATRDEARCPECRRITTPVYPRHLSEAWRLLRQRPVPNQNWTPTLEAAALNGTLHAETVDDLHRENQEHL